MDLQTLLFAVDFLRPVALLAGFPCRTEAFDRSRDGARIYIGDGGIDLVKSAQLGLDIPARSGSDMAFSTGYSGMGRRLVCRVFGIHHAVTQSPAEKD